MPSANRTYALSVASSSFDPYVAPTGNKASSRSRAARIVQDRGIEPGVHQPFVNVTTVAGYHVDAQLRIFLLNRRDQQQTEHIADGRCHADLDHAAR